MPIHLLKLLEVEILAHALQGETPKIVHATGGKWTFETIDLEFGELRVRLLKERGGVEILFGASQDALEWFNASETFRLLRCEVAFKDLAGAADQLPRLRHFLDAYLLTLTQLFSGARYRETRHSLLQIRRDINDALSPLRGPPRRA